MKEKIIQTSLDFLIIAIGSAMLAFATAELLDPYNIAPGGIIGMAMLFRVPFRALPLGLMVLAINVPLFVTSWRLLGHRFLLYTGFGTLVSSLLIDMFSRLPPVETEPLLAGVFGGLLMGAGLGLVFMRGATTGGSDIIVRLLKIPFPYIRIGTLTMVIDGLIVIAAGIVFGSVNNALYAVITLYISAKAMDTLLYGMNIERVVFIVSDRNEEITAQIFSRLGRGATLLYGEGAYTGTKRKIILCAVKRQQIVMLKRLIKETDPNAFIILADASEVHGEGFLDYEKNI